MSCFLILEHTFGKSYFDREAVLGTRLLDFQITTRPLLKLSSEIFTTLLAITRQLSCHNSTFEFTTIYQKLILTENHIWDSETVDKCLRHWWGGLRNQWVRDEELEQEMWMFAIFKNFAQKFRLCVGVNHFAIASVLLNIPLLQEVWQIWESECVLSNLIYQWGDLHTKKENQCVQKPGKLLQYCFSKGWNYGTKLWHRTSDTDTQM